MRRGHLLDGVTVSLFDDPGRFNKPLVDAIRHAQSSRQTNRNQLRLYPAPDSLRCATGKRRWPGFATTMEDRAIRPERVHGEPEKDAAEQERSTKSSSTAKRPPIRLGAQ